MELNGHGQDATTEAAVIRNADAATIESLVIYSLLYF